MSIDSPLAEIMVVNARRPLQINCARKINAAREKHSIQLTIFAAETESITMGRPSIYVVMLTCNEREKKVCYLIWNTQTQYCPEHNTPNNENEGKGVPLLCV